MKIGFIGLGIMGKPMALNLIKAGHDLVICEKSGAKDALTAKGAATEATYAKVAAAAPLVILMLPDSPQVEDVVMAEDGVLQGIGEGATIIDMSSIAPATSQKMAKAIEKKGAQWLDAPVSGGEPKAIDGSLSIMVGGEESVFEQYETVLRCMGASAVHCGPVGAGNTTKLANQIIVALNIAAVSEALVLGSKANVKPKVIHEAIRGGLAGSTVLDAKAPMMIEGNFQPGFKIDLHRKDLNNVLETARDLDVPLLLTPQVQEILKALKNDGKGQNDHSGIVEFYENLAKIKVRDQ